MLEKLGLGTVQFGQAYGVSNRSGQVSREEAAAILDRAAKAGVRLLDTAVNYGEAETILVALDTSPFRVVTKTINLAHGVDRVIARARQSAQSAASPHTRPLNSAIFFQISACISSPSKF